MKMRKFLNKNYTQISVYVIVVATIIMIISSFIGNVPYFFNMICEKIGWVISASQPIILALVFAYLLDPVVGFFERSFMKVKYLRKKENTCRALAVLVVCVIVVFVITAIISLLVSSITNQIRVANFKDIPVIINQYVDNLNDWYDKLTDKVGKSNIESLQIKESIINGAHVAVEWLTGAGTGFLSSISGITSFFVNLLISLIMSIYFMLDKKLLKFHIKRIALAFMKDETFAKVKSVADDADTVFSGYIRGQCMDAFCMMIMISIALSVTGVNMAVMIGILAGIGNLIPYVGPIVAYVGTILSCLINGDIHKMIIALIVLVVIQLIDGNVIGPKLLSNAVSIHPLIVIISLVFGSAIGGLLGMLLAVPVGALIKVLFMKYIDKRIKEKQRKMEERIKYED